MDNEKAKAIAAAAQELIKLRDHNLNPPEWAEWVITAEEQAAGFHFMKPEPVWAQRQFSQQSGKYNHAKVTGGGKG